MGQKFEKNKRERNRQHNRDNESKPKKDTLEIINILSPPSPGGAVGGFTFENVDEMALEKLEEAGGETSMSWKEHDKFRVLNLVLGLRAIC